jgi:di/tricarboxylate transporter
MSPNQIAILAVLLATLAMFMWSRWRHDMVALGSLLGCVFLGLVPGQDAFAGFGHPAVITVACVLVMGYGLQISGAVDVLAQRVLPASAGPLFSLLAIMALAAVLSGFMNNVGALALLMPIALQMAAKQNLPPGRLLMPLAFASILGGMVTLIGTPPNLIVSGFRAERGMGGYDIFDFTPVGLAVAAAGIAFITLIGWRLVPARKKEDAEGFETSHYLSEVRVTADNKAVDKPLREVEHLLDEIDAQVVGMVHRGFRVIAPNPRRMLRDGDILVIEVEPQSLGAALSALGLKLEEEVPIAAADNDKTEDAPTEEENPVEDKQDMGYADDLVIRELVVAPNAALLHRTARDIELRTRYGINLLAISHQSQRSTKRLRTTPIQAGDVLLMQGMPEAINGFAGEFGCLPLAGRDIRVPRKGQALTASLVMAAAVLLAAFGLFPAAVAFAAGALAMLALGVVPLRSAYTAIDWPVVVLLGAMLPVADAMAGTGAADLIARVLLDHVAQGHAIAGLVVVLVITMFLSDVMNNAATAAVMCPIALGIASQLGASPDAFLMAVAVGASCAFLTPIGHQNNTLILGPGGFRFGDYWRLGIALELIVVLVAVPMLLWVWPL